MVFDLAFIWAGLIAFAVLTYVVLDGFDLGIGILFPFGKSEADRDLMMNSVAPVWDGNETWLVLGGGGLFAVFPLAYAIVMPALYMPITLMLLALVFRGVSFEYRWRAERKGLWDVAFFGGSFVAALCQGIALGALVQGIEIEGRAYAGVGCRRKLMAILFGLESFVLFGLSVRILRRWVQALHCSESGAAARAVLKTRSCRRHWPNSPEYKRLGCNQYGYKTRGFGQSHPCRRCPR